MKIKRRDFLGFFLLGGLTSLIIKKLRPKNQLHLSSPYQGKPRGEKEAMFWRRKA